MYLCFFASSSRVKSVIFVVCCQEIVRLSPVVCQTVCLVNIVKKSSKFCFAIHCAAYGTKSPFILLFLHSSLDTFFCLASFFAHCLCRCPFYFSFSKAQTSCLHVNDMLSVITSESKKPGQISVVYHYCDLSRFFRLRR